MRKRMTNQSLRDCFHLPDSKSVIVSQIIAATMEAGLIRADERVGSSRKFAHYLSLWA
jgi:ATP-dependent DNA helicase RecG